MKTKFFRKSIYILLLVSAIISFQNCSPNFGTLGDESTSLESSGMSLSADSFRAAKDTELDQLQQNCPEPEYRNFKCLNKVLRTQEGLDYAVTFRWNRIGQESNGTVIWVLGNNGKGVWRAFPGSAPIQDDFDRNKNIRSVEIDFTDAPKTTGNSGGYWSHGGGYYSAAQAYMAAVAYVVANLKSGAFLNHVGGSNGTMVAAYSLSHFGAGQYVDRFILHAGPFLPDLQEACDTNHFASFSKSPSMYQNIIEIMGTWTYLDASKNVCADSSVNTINRLSVLKNSVKSYPQNGIHVVMGEKEKTEGFGDWILQSNFSWYSQIEAAEKTREVISSIGHEMYWLSVASFASRPKPSPMGAAPSLTFSTTRDGAATTQVAANSKVYGVVRNIDASSAQACMAESARIADCSNPHNWTSFPNADWKFDGSVWRSEFTPQQLGITAGKSFIGFNINTRTGQRTPLATLTIVEDVVDPRGTESPPVTQRPAPTLTISKSYNGASESRYSMDDTVYGVAKNLPGNGVKGCMQESSQFYLCNDPKNWQSLPNGNWSYVNGEWRAQFSPRQLGGVAGKTYVGFQVNTATGERTPNFSFSVLAASPQTPTPGPSVISEGLFMAGAGIYYSNGSSYCHFGTMAQFTQITGRTDANGIRQISILPASMKNDGTCRAP